MALLKQCNEILMFPESTLTECYTLSDWGTLFWTAGQRIDPTRNSTFVWRVMSSNARGETLSAMTYTNWLSGQPDYAWQRESCMHLSSGRSYKWNDQSCSNARCSVCELDIWVYKTACVSATFHTFLSECSLYVSLLLQSTVTLIDVTDHS